MATVVLENDLERIRYRKNLGLIDKEDWLIH